MKPGTVKVIGTAIASALTGAAAAPGLPAWMPFLLIALAGVICGALHIPRPGDSPAPTSTFVPGTGEELPVRPLPKSPPPPPPPPPSSGAAA